MDSKTYIASGILELYVAGQLSEKENAEVARYAQEYPEIQQEIEAIETAVLQLSSAASPGMPNNGYEQLQSRLGKIIDLQKSRNKTNWSSYFGWAASLVLACGLLWMFLQNDKLSTEIETVSKENKTLKEQIIEAREKANNNNELLDAIRDKNVAVVSLGGQAVAPETFAKAYWNKAEQKVYIDAEGLPEPPPGYDYQVWSLTLNPLTPTSLGLLEDFANNETGLFELPNDNSSEAFGITLEPEGGSASPTLEQLYVLGTTS